ncbi:MAG: RNA polymerase sigma factor [Archangium sp.]|nr:RNA polymerase sigma factor [Archangium sp.]
MADSKLTAGAAEGELRLEELDDDQLMTLTRQGQVQAFRTLVRRHQGQAVAFGTRYLGQHAQAADAAQEAFVELFLSVPRYEPRGRFASYWHQILLNQCRMVVRSRQVASLATTRLEALPPNEPLQAEAVLIAHQDQQAVQRALEMLGEKLRAVVALRFAAGLSLQEIADTLEVPLGTVKSRLFAGLGELREALRGSER